jgi:activator of HSP90 ATPase
MATRTIELEGFVPATPERLYAAWLDAKGHSAMTGAKATVESTAIGGRFTAWGGYIEGTHVDLEPGRRLFQSWRATDFPADAPESYLEVIFLPAAGGATVRIRHTEVPEKLAASLLKGWKDFYLKPMVKYFGKSAPAKKAPAKRKAAAKRKAPAKRAKRKKTPAKRKARR